MHFPDPKHTAEDKQWFAFHVRPRHEKSVAQAMVDRSFVEFLPLVREKRCWGNRTRHVDLPLFPGYVFCQVALSGMRRALTIPGVIDVVRAGFMPLAADGKEVEALRRAAAMEAPLESCAFTDRGHAVRLTVGPLAGLEGILVDVRKSQRLVLAMSLLHRSVMVEVEPNWIAPHPDFRVVSQFQPAPVC